MTVDGPRFEDGPVLVTGASGFVGRHLLHALQSNLVVAWSRSPAPQELATAARWQQVDLSRREEVRRALRDLRPRYVFHLAGATQVDRSWAHPAEILDANVVATQHLFDGLRRIGDRARVLITGSATVYAPSSLPIAETSPTAPDSPYALSKLAQEMLALRAVAEDGLDVVVTRSFNHTGAGQSPSFAAASFARQVAWIERGRQEPVVKVGNLDPVRDISDVRDVVRAYAALMARAPPVRSTTWHRESDTRCGGARDAHRGCTGADSRRSRPRARTSRRNSGTGRRYGQAANAHPLDSAHFIRADADDLLDYWRSAT
jgi:GDP-4-dehydro-6-deoxy-D-mannose reductase